MNAHLTYDVAVTRIDDMHRDAARHTRDAAATSVTVRPATQADASALVTLAALDSAPVPAGQILIAEVGGQAQAAIGVESGAIVADPFRRTATTVRILRAHAAQTRREQRRSRAPRYRRVLARSAA